MRYSPICRKAIDVSPSLTGELCHQMWMPIINVFQHHIVHISYDDWHVHVMDAWKKLEHSVGLEVVVRFFDILAECEAWLSRTGGIGGLSGSDIVLSGPTEVEDWDEQYQQVARHTHCCAMNR